MKVILLLLLMGCSPTLQPTLKAQKSKRPKTDIIIMVLVLGTVVWWCNDEGFTKHVK